MPHTHTCTQTHTDRTHVYRKRKRQKSRRGRDLRDGFPNTISHDYITWIGKLILRVNQTDGCCCFYDVVCYCEFINTKPVIKISDLSLL